MTEEKNQIRRTSETKKNEAGNIDMHLIRIRAHLQFILFLTAICLFYIFNSHSAEKTIRKIDEMNKKIRELRWEYATSHASLVFNSRESEVVRRAEVLGLKPPKVPPYRIRIENE